MTAVNPSPNTESTHGPGPRLMTADTLTGDSVVNPQGEELGHIEDIMIDVPRGRVAYAVMSSGGFLGMGDKLFALPWEALTLDPERECFVLDADKQRFEQAPGFDKGRWPSSPDFGLQQEEQLYDYWGARRYWE